MTGQNTNEPVKNGMSSGLWEGGGRGRKGVCADWLVINRKIVWREGGFGRKGGRRRKAVV